MEVGITHQLKGQVMNEVDHFQLISIEIKGSRHIQLPLHKDPLERPFNSRFYYYFLEI